MRHLFRLAAAFAAGAVAMYYLDPRSGRRRRALVRDQGVAATHDLRHFVGAKSRRMGDRLHGVVARARARLADAPVDDDLLRERVRARLGHLVRHPGAIEVKVHDGRVVLSGTAASRDEIDGVVRAILSMHRVEEVDNLLAPDFSAGAEVLGAQH